MEELALTQCVGCIEEVVMAPETQCQDCLKYVCEDCARVEVRPGWYPYRLCQKCSERAVSAA